jgi:hypothetical protein
VYRLPTELDACQLHQVVDRARHALRLVDHLARQAAHDLRLLAVGERLGEHGQRPDRSLQLMADVGHEVGAHGVQPGALADVVDRDEHVAGIEPRRVEQQHPPRWAEELQAPRAFATVEASDDPLQGLADEHPLVTVEPGRPVADFGLATRVDEHHTDRQGVERSLQAAPFACLALGGRAAALLLRPEAVCRPAEAEVHHSSSTSTGATRGSSPEESRLW